MNDTKPSPSQVSTPQGRNLATHETHRRQSLWQITIPLAILASVFLILTVVVSLSGAEYQSRWADISLIWILCPNLILSLVCLGLPAGLVFLMYKLLRLTPDGMFRAQNFFWKVQAGVKKASDMAVAPVLKAQSSRAGQQAMWRNIRNIFKRSG